MALTKIRGDGVSANTITSPLIANGSIQTSDIEDNAIVAAKIADGTITDNKLVTPPFSTGKAIAMSIVFS